MTRAMYRGYPASGSKRSARVTRLHIIRDTPVATHRTAYRPFHDPPAEQTWCGQGAGRHVNSDPVIIDPVPLRTPEGLSWCPACIGWLAARYGLLDEIAESLAAVDPDMFCDPHEPQRAARRAALIARQRGDDGGAGVEYG